MKPTIGGPVRKPTKGHEGQYGDVGCGGSVVERSGGGNRERDTDGTAQAGERVAEDGEAIDRAEDHEQDAEGRERIA